MFEGQIQCYALVGSGHLHTVRQILPCFSSMVFDHVGHDQTKQPSSLLGGELQNHQGEFWRTPDLVANESWGPTAPVGELVGASAEFWVKVGTGVGEKVVKPCNQSLGTLFTSVLLPCFLCPCRMCRCEKGVVGSWESFCLQPVSFLTWCSWQD